MDDEMYFALLFFSSKTPYKIKKNFLYLCFSYISKYGSSTSYLFLTLNNILAFIHSFILSLIHSVFTMY